MPMGCSLPVEFVLVEENEEDDSSQFPFLTAASSLLGSVCKAPPSLASAFGIVGEVGGGKILQQYP